MTNRKIWGLANLILITFGCVIISFHEISGLIINVIAGISTLFWILYPFFKKALAKEPS
jgi:hypothetical protein